MIHYHGTPITPRDRLYEIAGRHFCVSYADPRDVNVCHEIGQSVMLDNGAFSFWRSGRGTDWDGYYDWAAPWLDFPTTWAVIPDVIDGSEADNDALLIEWFQTRLPKGAPVWHMHEPLERLRRLAHGYDRVCFGSSGVFATVGTPAWHRRIAGAFDTIADEDGRVPWVHMLRGLDLAGSHYPFASADSSNVAQNHARQSQTVARMAYEIDSRQNPARWYRVGEQRELPDMAKAGRPAPDYNPRVDYPERYSDGPY